MNIRAPFGVRREAALWIDRGHDQRGAVAPHSKAPLARRTSKGFTLAMAHPRLIAEKNAEIDVLSGLNLTEVTPSRRDFAMFVATQKSGITLIPRLKRADPDTDQAWPGLDLVSLARQLDDTEVGALAVATAGYYGTSIGDLPAVAEAVTAPILRDDLCFHRLQIFQARLHAADAVIIQRYRGECRSGAR
jgi:hypothetical protein